MPVTAGIYYTLFEGGSQLNKPVVLIHGAGSSSKLWPAELRRLPGRTVYTLDLPGHGRSGSPGSQSAAGFAAALVEFMASLDLYRAFFIGHDLGGAAVLQLALDFPEHVMGIACLSSGAFFNPPGEFLAQLSAPSSTSAAQHWLSERLRGAKPLSATEKELFSLQPSARTSVLYNDWLACARFDLRSQLKQIQVPAYIACGAHDRMTPPALSRYLADGLPAAHLEIIPASGHLLPLEQPVRLAASLGSFITEVETVNANYPLPSLFKQNGKEAADNQNGQNGLRNGE